MTPISPYAPTHIDFIAERVAEDIEIMAELERHPVHRYLYLSRAVKHGDPVV